MLLFVGKEEKGYFAEEGHDVTYVDSNLHIEEQSSAILQKKEGISNIIYDIEQYADAPEEITKWVLKIQDALQVGSIIFAPAYNPQSKIIQMLWQAGVKNFILSFYLSDQKEDLEYCLSGYFETFGYAEKRGITFDEPEPEPEEEQDQIKSICVGIAGCCPRMGTTTQALQIVKALQFVEKKAAYVEMNDHGLVQAIVEAYEDVTCDEELGKVTYGSVDMFYRIDKLQEVLNKDYDYLIFDYGVAGENGFNKVSFLEKEKQIFVVGSKPGGEFEKTYNVIKNNFYNNVFYIYNFVAASEQKDILELMEEKAKATFFAEEAKDPFVFSGDMKTYENILSLEEKGKVKSAKKKKRLFKRRR
jgi:hypothetical protein